MRIGIDIDGVITDIARFIIDYGTKFCVENNIEYKIKEDEYHESKAMGITIEQSEEFWNTYLGWYAKEYPTRDFVAEIIRELRKRNQVYIITARNEDGLPTELYGTMQEMVKKWLKDKNVEYDKLIFTQGSKLPYCIENNIDVMIEDSPTNILDIATEIPVLCFDNPYNKNIEGNNITRVYSWYDILSKIEKISTSN